MKFSLDTCTSPRPASQNSSAQNSVTHVAQAATFKFLSLKTFRELTPATRMLRFIPTLFFYIAVVPITAGIEIQDRVDWARFMKRQDPVWTVMPERWLEAPFVGNAELGSMFWQIDTNRIHVLFSSSAVEEHGGTAFIDSNSRLPTGHFELTTKGEIQNVSFRLDLWNAEVVGEIRTSIGTVMIRQFIHTDTLLMVFETAGSDGETGGEWTFHPAEAINLRYTYKKLTGGRPDKNPPVINPPWERSSEGDVELCIQDQTDGGQSTTAWKIEQQDHRQILFATIIHTFPELNSTDKALELIQTHGTDDIPVLRESHRTWWHDFYQRSYISIPDERWESFYWLQLYKFACATRPDRPLMGLMGPWTVSTPWPAIWWNLNIQLQYWIANKSNHTDLAEALPKTLDARIETLSRNVPEQFRHDSAAIGVATSTALYKPIKYRGRDDCGDLGSLTWVLHNYWMHCAYSGDYERMKTGLFPLLKRSVNLYLHLLEKSPDGTYHLPPTTSPEYGIAPDCNYSLSLLRWGCRTLVDIAEEHRIEDPLLETWKDVLANLTDYPTNENGYMIGKGVPFEKGHRHFSHLLMIFPLHLIEPDSEDSRNLLYKSIDHWHSKGGLVGYSFCGASSMASIMGDGAEALRYLEKMDDYVSPNTFYSESGAVIETPLATANSILDMLIQSRNGKIEVFPAVADSWRDVNFRDLRTEGAFNITAKRKDRKTLFVKVESEIGGTCIIYPNIEGDVHVDGIDEGRLIETGAGEYTVETRPGESFILYVSENEDFSLSPVALQGRSGNFWGLSKFKLKRGWR